MELLFELLKIIIPSFIVFYTAYKIIIGFFENQEKQKKQELVINNSKVITPIRLQAYERIILLLERISPDSIVMRHSQNVKTAQELQRELLIAIRAEYEHNLSQQIYVTSETWEMVVNAKGNLIKLINTVADGIEDNAPALKLSQAILEKVMEIKKSPVFDAIEKVKGEVRELMG